MFRNKEKKTNDISSLKSSLLIALCWLVYTCSYLGKLGYNANITKIESVYNVSHSTAGTVSTFFFFSYGIGQILNGFFCKKYHLRFMVFGALLLSALMNICVAICKDFSLLKYFWLVNGLALSILWPSLIRLLSENLDKKDMGRAVIVMGTTVATGTLLIYGLSALCVALGSYTTTFFIAGILLPVIAVVWFFTCNKLMANNKVEVSVEEEREVERVSGGLKDRTLLSSICVLAFFAVIVNLVKDGLTTWVPMILKETYDLPDYASILLTLVLPILAIFGTGVAVFLRKKVNDFVGLCSVLFAIASAFIFITLLCLPTDLFLITLLAFGAVACTMSGVNNVITSMAPLYWKDKVNSGKIAGILNGFCYLGSTLSSYGLGLVSDMGGWNAVLILLLSLCILCVIMAVVYFAIKKSKRNQPLAR